MDPRQHQVIKSEVFAPGDLAWIRTCDEYIDESGWHVYRDIGPALILDVEKDGTYVKYFHEGVASSAPSIYFIKISSDS